MSLARSSLLLSTGRAASGIARLLVNLGIARLFAEQTGFTAEYQKVWLVLNTSYMLFVFGLPQSLYYFYPRAESDADRQRLVGHVHGLLTAFGLLYALALWLGAPLLARFYGSPELALHLKAFAPYGFAMVATMSLEAVFNLLGKFKALAAWMMIEALIFMGAALLPVAGGLQGSLPAFLAERAGFASQESSAIHAAFMLLSIMGMLKFILYHGWLKFRAPAMSFRMIRVNGRQLGDILSYSLPILATSLVVYLAMYMDKNVVAASFKDSGVYAIFQAGAMEVPFVSVLVGSVTAVMLPRLSRLQFEGDQAGMARLLANGVTRLAWLIFPLFTLLFVCADALYLFFWGPAYADSALPFRIYLLVFPLRLMYYGQVLNTLGKQRWVFWIAVGDLLLNMALSLWWVRLMGMPGPAWATAVATMVELIVFIWLIRRTLGLPLAQLLPPGELMRSARLALMAGLAAVGGILIGHSPLEELLCAGILHAVVYLGLQLPGGELKRRLGELVK